MSSRCPYDTHHPDVRAIIIGDYEQYGRQYVQTKYQVAPSSIRRWRSAQANSSSLEPNFQNCGAREKLGPELKFKLLHYLDNNPFATNVDLARVVGNVITPRSVSNYIRRSEKHYAIKWAHYDAEGAFTQRHFDLGKKFCNQVRRIPLARRVYVDETYVIPALRRKRCRSKANAPYIRPQNPRYQRRCIISAVRQSGMVHRARVLKVPTATTQQFEQYVIRTLKPKLKSGDVVIWDRWGRSGRASHPTAHHYSPRAHKALADIGVEVMFLPPYGKYLNPIELIFRDIRAYFEKERLILTPSAMPRQITYSKLRPAWWHAEKRIGDDNINVAFSQRANGKEFFKKLRDTDL